MRLNFPLKALSSLDGGAQYYFISITAIVSGITNINLIIDIISGEDQKL